MTRYRLQATAVLLVILLVASMVSATVAFAGFEAAKGQVSALELVSPNFVSFAPQVTASDPIDVGFAPSCGAGPSGSGFVGWDIDEVGVAYVRSTDTLFVGVSMWNNVIAGDPENNGNPNTTDPCLQSSGGRDIANLGESEAIDFVIDAGNNGSFEYIAGVSRTTDINGFTVAQYTGLQPPPTSPGLGFGASAGSGSITNNPAAGAPDFEFKINNFSALLGKTPNDTLTFCFAARAGSQEDNGFGEDSIPGAGCIPVTFEAYDFGDDPDPSYPTLLASNGAYHVIDGVTYLGSRVDAEPNGQPNANADGDDLNGVPDDEDGIVFNTPLVQCQQATLTATASASGRLDAWIDFNGDGDWADAGEKVANSQLLNAGANAINYTVPCSAVPGTTYTRFRFSKAGGLSYTGKAPDGEVEDYKVQITAPRSAIDIQKTVYAGHNAGASCPGGELVTGVTGTQVTYCFVVTNTGDTYLSPVTLSDANLGITQAQMTLKSGTVPLAPGATLVYYYQTTITNDLTNTACTDGNPSDAGGADLPGGVNVTDCDTAQVDKVTPAIEIQKTVYAGHNSGASCPGGELVTGVNGTKVTYCFVVTNTGDTYLSPVTINDANLGITQAQMTLKSGTVPLAPGASLVYYYQTTITKDLANTACTEGNPSTSTGADLPNAPNVTDCDDAQVDLVTPAIDIKKTVYAGHNAGASCPGGELVTGVSGAQVTYCFVVTNTGDTYLSPVTLSDADLGITQAQMTLKSGTVPLAPGATLVYYYQTTITRALTNTACTDGNPSTASGADLPNAPNVTDCDTAQVNLVAPAIEIQKTVYAGHNSGASCPGGELVTGVTGTNVTYCFVVTNTGSTYLSPVTINDANLGITQAQMTLKSGTVPLAPGASLVYYYQTTITGDLTNTACTEGNPSDAGGADLPGGVNVTDCDTAQVDRVTPGIDIQKTVYAGHNSGASCPGGELVTGVSGTQVTYCFVVTNTGDTYLSPVTLSDANLGITQAQMTLKSGTLPLAPGATLVYYYQTTITKDLANTACTDGNPSNASGADLPNAPNVTDCDTAQVDLVRPAIDIQKTVYTGHNAGASCPGGELVTGVTGTQVTYCFVVTNTGDTYLNPVTLSDANLGITQAQMTLKSGILPLAPGATLVYYYQTTITKDLTNTACTDGNPSNASGADLPGLANVTDCDTAQVDLVAPAIDIQKTVYAGHNAGASCPGGELVTGVTGTQVTYCFEVTNTGDMYLNPVTVNDVDLGITQAQMTLKSGTLPLAPGAKLVYYYQTTITRDLTNTACADGNPSNASGGDIPGVPNVNDCDNAQVELVAPAINIQKTVYAGHNNGASCPGSELVSGINGASVTYCFEVTNTGDTYLDPVTLSDADLGITQAQMTLKSGVVPLAPGAKLVYYYQTSIQSDLVNTACTDGNPSNASGGDLPGIANVTDCDTAEVRQIGPGVALEKTVLTCHNCSPAAPPACPGDELVIVADGSAITYCFEVVNTGDTYLNNVVISDPDLGITTANMTLLSGSLPLAPGQSIVYYYKTFSAGDLVNLAKVTGNPTDASGNDLPGAPDVDDEDTAQVQELRLVDLGDWAWNDANRNGIQDAGELGLANVVVKLYRADGTFLGSKTTNANGYYLFTDLGPGDYYLEFTGPAGWVHSPHLKGTDRAKDSDPNQFSGRTWTITLDGSADNLTVDAGFYFEPSTAHLGDFIWNDLNQDGLQDAGEPGIAGVLVCLYNDVDRDGAYDPGSDTPVAGAGDQPAPYGHCVRTPSSGYYLFPDLPAGMYIVQVDSSNFNTGQPLKDTIGSPPNRGTNDQIDSDCSQASNAAAWNLVAGVNWLGLDCGFHRAEPTPVVMLEPDTYVREINGMVQIHWATATEQNIAGFNILRGVVPDASRAVRLNAQVISGRGSAGRGVSYYRFDDRTLQPGAGAYLYWVQVVERDGSTDLPVAPMKVVLTGQRVVFVPTISVR